VSLVIAASVLHYIRSRRGKVSADTRQAGADVDFDQRLVEIERRMTDTQDVMIALSDKMDRWEEERTLAGRERATSSTQ